MLPLWGVVSSVLFSVRISVVIQRQKPPRPPARRRQPVFIYGEPGTGKEQIARYLYLHSSLANHPFIVVNCALLNEKTWDFLLNHYNSPLSATGNTIYFQNFESISPQWSS